jgi:NAD(P)-dependent dehydrogenase (short-subunit alcohol dehydrogenase family)
MSSTYLFAGGSSGIGYETVKMLLDQGNKIIVFSRERKNLPIEVEHHVFDFKDTSSVWPDLKVELDGLVYFPGSILLKPFKSLKISDFENDYKLNVLGAVQIIQKYLPKIKKNTISSIVLMSTVAVQTGMPFHSLVSSSKGAIEGLTRSLAAELAPFIRVNAIAPSLTETPLAANLIQGEARLNAAQARHPLQSIGNAKDIAAWVCHLLSDKSKFVSGQVFKLDGGMSDLRK